jgi:uncharacterized protein with HEPN domain
MIPDADRIRHMLEAISKMRISIDGMSREEFLANDDKKAVAERYIMIVGEAAHMVSKVTKAKYPQVAWQDANDMRNMVAHEYMQVDYDDVWKVITAEFKILEGQLLEIAKDFPMPPADVGL